MLLLRQLAVRFFHFAQGRLFGVRIFLSKTVSPNAVREVFRLLRPSEFEGSLKRYGEEGDGGYLMPSELGTISALFSPGVADKVSFELSLAKLGIPSLLIDGSITSLPFNHPLLFFTPVWLGPQTNTASRTISLDDWVQGQAPPGDLILQMDIEGDEYLSLLSASETTLLRFKIIVLELHNLSEMFVISGNRLIRGVLLKLLKTHFVVHAHANNTSSPIRFLENRIPRIIELTLVRRDSFSEFPGHAILPHPLDMPNSTGSVLEPRWEKAAGGLAKKNL